MKIHGLGKDISDSFVDGRRDRLDQCLAYTQELGYGVAELGITGLSIIINGALVSQRVQSVKSTLDQYDFRYSVHAPNRTNLAFSNNYELEKRVLIACIEFCHEIGARTLVYHSGLQALNAARTGAVALPGDDELAQGVEREIAALRELAPVAESHGVTLGLENGDPHLWEYVVLHQNDKQPKHLPKYHGRLRIPNILVQLQAVDHPAVGMTLDLAHLHLAVHAVGDDYLYAVEQAAPWVRHLHMNDNFGVLDVGYDSESDRLPYGEADLHLPPGWGAIPFKDAFAKLADYEGDIILEIKDRYWDHFGEALENTRKLLQASAAELPG